MRANPLTPNLRAGFVIMASLPTSTVVFISELLAEGVAPIPLDGSTVVEGTVYTTAVSSPDNKVHGILAARLRKAKTQIKTCKSTTSKYSITSITSYSPVASSFGGAAMLPRHWPSTPQALGLGISTWSGAMLPITPFPRCCIICTTKSGYQYFLYETSYEHTKIWLTDRENWKNKRTNKCLVAKDYS